MVPLIFLRYVDGTLDVAMVRGRLDVAMEGTIADLWYVGCTVVVFMVHVALVRSWYP